MVKIRHSLNTLSLFGGLCALLALAGCTSALSSRSDAPPTQNPPLDALTWSTYDQAEANDYLQMCRTDFDLGVAQLRGLEKDTFNDRDFLLALNKLDITADRIAGLASLYHNVHPNPTLREAAGECEQKVMTLLSEVSRSVPIYSRLKKVKQQGLPALDQRYVADLMEGFELSGVNKSAAVREQLTRLNDEIVKTGQEFSRNIREDIRKVYATPAELNGLPADFIEAHPVDQQGRIELTTQYPDYLPVMQYATSDDLRLRLYQAFRQRGYPANEAQLQKLLAQRHEYASLLGFANYAEYATYNKMIETPANAQSFIDRIASIAQARSQSDKQRLLQRLQVISPQASQVTDWQKSYLENLVRTEDYEVDAQEVRQYFAYGKVKQGIFDLVEELFDVEIVPWQTEVWHPSVESWQIEDDGELIGQFYLDMHPREGKYSHAASFGIRTGVRDVQTPINALICNFPGGGDGPGLMEHDQVETFLHEFGHLLHGLFGGHQPWLAMSGVATEWDFVEAPSQMLEEWVWDAQTLKTFAVSPDGNVIPDDLIAKMNAARRFGKGIWTTQQMYYAALSLNYYNRPAEEVDLDRMMIDLAGQYAPFPYVDDTYFYASFGHLDGYSAIYYTYMWSLVIAADMFSEFEAHGLRNKEVAARYRQAILEAGGTKDAADLVQDFLGRPYSFEAFAETLTEN